MKILIPNSLWYANFVIELCISINALRSIQFSLYEKYVNNNFIFRNKISMIPNMSCFKIGIPTISRYFLEVFQTISYFNLQYCRITINSHCLGPLLTFSTNMFGGKHLPLYQIIPMQNKCNHCKIGTEYCRVSNDKNIFN